MKSNDPGGVNEIIPSCQALSMQHEDVCEQFLCTKLRPLKGCIRCHHVEFSGCVKSNTVHMSTRYERTVYHAMPFAATAGQYHRGESVWKKTLVFPFLDVYVTTWNWIAHLETMLSKTVFTQQRRDAVLGVVFCDWNHPSSYSVVDVASSEMSAFSSGRRHRDCQRRSLSHCASLDARSENADNLPTTRSFSVLQEYLQRLLILWILPLRMSRTVSRFLVGRRSKIIRCLP